jgi:hypothetical protein
MYSLRWDIFIKCYLGELRHQRVDLMFLRAMDDVDISPKQRHSLVLVSMNVHMGVCVTSWGAAVRREQISRF